MCEGRDLKVGCLRGKRMHIPILALLVGINSYNLLK